MARKWKHGEPVLVVEGYSDLLFFAELLEHVGRPNVFIKDMGGKGNFTRTALEAFLAPPVLAGAPAIAVISDADADGAAAASALSDTLTAISGTRVQAGAWTVGTPRLGCYVVPAPQAGVTGAIEALVLLAYESQADNSLVPCLDAYMKCASAHGRPASHPDKARASALFAQLNPDDPRLGPTARAGRLDLNAAPYAALRAFLAGFPA